MKKTNLLILLSFLTLNLFAWEGEGTLEKPYKISSPQDLIELSNSSEYYEGVYFVQTQEIDMQDVDDFRSIGCKSGGFKGFYDGQNFKIKNLKVSKGYAPGLGGGWTHSALFGDVRNGIIKNVHIAGDSRFEGYNHIASIVAECTNTEIRNCTSSAVIEAASGDVGGIVGKGGKIYNCKFTGSITALGTYSSYIGGIVGSINGTGEIVNCTNTGTIKGNGYVGGIAGYIQVDGVICDCYNRGSVSSNSDYVGGIVGHIPMGLVSSAIIEKCHNSGNVKGTNYVGGITGYSAVFINVSGNLGDVEGTGDFVGGITGRGYAFESYNKGNVTGNEKVGGIAGILIDGKNCYSIGNVSGTERVGGLVGSIDGYSNTLFNSYCVGNVTATGEYVGAVVGFMNTGGLTNSNEIKNTYWNSDIYAGKGVGNLNNVTADFQYYPKTTVELKNNFSITLNDGGNAWKEDGEDINYGYPILSNGLYPVSVEKEPSALSNIKVYSFGNQIYIANEKHETIKQVDIFDITGRALYRNSTVQNVISLDAPAGIYIVRLITGTEAKGYKVVLTK